MQTGKVHAMGKTALQRTACPEGNDNVVCKYKQETIDWITKSAGHPSLDSRGDYAVRTWFMSTAILTPESQDDPS